MNDRMFLLPAAVLAAGLLSGCGGDDGNGGSSAAAFPTTSAPAATTSTSPPVATASTSPAVETSSPARDGGARTGGAVPEAPGAPRSPGVPGAPPAPQSAQPARPAEVAPVHGGRVWAVYLAVGSPDSEWDMHMLGETEGYLQGRYGYTGSGIGSVGCDQGAAEALGFDPQHHRVAVYFASAARAQEFQAGYDRQDAGSAEVTTYCLD